MVQFVLSVLNLKYYFGANLAQNIKIIHLNRNLVPRLIWTCRIQWYGYEFVRLEILFLGKLCPENQNLVLRLISICRIQWGCAIFLVLNLNTFLGHIFVP